MEHTLGLLIPVLALSIPVAAIVIGGLSRVMRLRIEEARARHPVSDQSAELDELRDEVAQLRNELSEVQERLDFTERILARNDSRARLPEPPQSTSRTVT